MTLNGLIALILHFFSPNSIVLQADYVKFEVEMLTYNVRKILSPSSSLPLLAKLMHPADSGALVSN